jgi:hypothetical protein
MRTWVVILLSIVTAGCAGQQRCVGPVSALGAMRVPAFPLSALQSRHALKAKFYLDADGALSKVSVHVTHAGIPDWVHAAADQQLGKGEEVELEVEQYANGDTAYEVTRLVAGKKVELSVRSTDRRTLYLERQDLPLDSMPAAVKQAVAGIAGFAAKGVDLKETGDPATTIYKVAGELGGSPIKLLITPTGKITTTRRAVPAALELSR